MFSKRTCQRCGKKTSKENNFCPVCGLAFGKIQNREDYGLLGEDDSMERVDPFSNPLFGGLGGGFMNKMISNTMKMLEKEMEKEMKGNANPQNAGMPKTRIKLMINGKEINLGEGTEANKKERPAEKPAKSRKFSDEQIKRFSKLPRKEPKTNLKRVADRIIYEMEIPGVDSVENISITPLENSVEIKAIGEEKAYSKSIGINLPIMNYILSNERLILEFKGD